MSASRADDRGSATLLVTAVLGLVLLVGCALAVVGAMVVAHRRAQSAADLAALAGATALAHGADACAEVGRIATAGGARPVACAVEGRDVLVTVSTAGPHWLGQRGDLAATARAGPDG